jgi:HAMP domain-containing protein
VISLRSVLNRVHGDVHVIDHRMRSMLDTGGFIPFREVHDNGVRAAASAALSPDGTASAPKSTRRVVVASVVGDGAVPAAAGTGTATAVPKSPAGTLGWVVVVSRDVGDLVLPTTQALHVAWLLMVLAVTVAVVGWGWQYTVFVRPLKALAAAAERVTDGDHQTPITPERFDEIGALAMCLEVCRQTRSEGSERLAGAVRLRGAGQDYTLVMPRIKA